MITVPVIAIDMHHLHKMEVSVIVRSIHVLTSSVCLVAVILSLLAVRIVVLGWDDDSDLHCTMKYTNTYNYTHHGGCKIIVIGDIVS